MITMLFSILIVVVAIILGVWIIYAVLSLAPWFPTRKNDIDIIDGMVQWQDETVFYDLGSGDGRVCLWLAQRHPSVQFVAVEISFILHVIAWIRVRLSRCMNVEVVRGNALHYDVSDGDYVYVFGTHRTIDHIICDVIGPKVGSGAQIISYNFSIRKWEGIVRESKVKGHTKVFIYEKSV